MKKLSAKYREIPAGPSIAAALLVAVILAVLTEAFVFRFSYFSQFFGGYEELRIDLSAYDAWNGEAYLLTPEDGTGSVSFDGLSLKVRSVTVVTYGSSGLLTGNIGICDEANAYKTVGAGSFSVNPGGTMNTFTVRISSHGDLSRLRITFDELDEPIFLISVTLNAYEPLSLNLPRILLMSALFAAVILTIRFRLYAQDFDPDKRTHRALNLGVMLSCIVISLGVLYAESPEGGVLIEYPTLEELRADSSEYGVYGVYAQQLDAFEKGRIELDLDVNPELEELDNPYDTGERGKKDVSCYWDRAYYNGKYYCYFGLSPLFMVYYPVYMLTGMLPTIPFASCLLAIFAVICIFAAVKALIRLFSPRANLLLFLLGEAALVCGCFLFALQASGTYYYLPLLAAIGWLAAFIALSVTAVRNRTAWKRAVLFALSGIAFVMIVMSRPTAALLAVLFAIPLFVGVLRDGELSLKSRLAGSALPFLVPVIIGGIAIMWYNYIRFDSVFEFGTSYQLTESDIRYNSVYLSLKNFGGMLYHYFAESLVFSEFFPFVSFTADQCLDFGNYLYDEASAGLLNMPLNFGIFLLIPFTAAKSRTKKDTLAKQTFVLLSAGVLALGYLDYMLGGVHIRYVCDLSLIVSIIAFMMIIDQVHPDGTRSARILYVIALSAMIATIIIGVLLIFSNEHTYIKDVNPDFFLKISRLFHE